MPPPYLPPEKVEAAIRKASLETGVAVTLLRAVAYVESRFNPKAVSPKGARGLFQIMPATAAAYFGPDVGEAPELLFQPSLNASAGAILLHIYLGRYSDVTLALYIYNMGEAAYARLRDEGRPVPTSVRRYATQVQAVQHYYRAQVPPVGDTLQERLGNAIVALANENPNDAEIVKARDAWIAEIGSDPKKMAVDQLTAAQSSAMKDHWQRYNANYRIAAIDDRSPLPDVVEPDIYHQLNDRWDDVEHKVDQNIIEPTKKAAKDAGEAIKAGLERAGKLAKETVEDIGTGLEIGALVALGLVVLWLWPRGNGGGGGGSCG